MMNRKPGLLTQAFEATYYNRTISKEAPFSSFFSAIFALPTKYKRKGYNKVEVSQDRNVFNWTERLLLPVTVAKNIAKFGTEFIWNLASDGLVEASDQLKARANAVATDADDNDDESYLTAVKYYGLKGLGHIVKGLSFLPWMVAKVGQSITSPFAAMKETSAYVQYKTGSKVLGYLAAGLRGLITVGAYAAIAVFAAPAIAAPLAASGTVGSQIVAGLGSAASWVASLPVISTIGSTFAAGMATVGSALGLSVSAGFASAAAIAATAIVATPVLAGLKALVRYLSPFKPKQPGLSAPRLQAQQPLVIPQGPLTGMRVSAPSQSLNYGQQQSQASNLDLSLLPHTGSTHQHVHAAFSSSALNTTTATSTGSVLPSQPVTVKQTVTQSSDSRPSARPTGLTIVDSTATQTQQRSRSISPPKPITPPALVLPTASVLASSSATFQPVTAPTQAQLEQQLEELNKKQAVKTPTPSPKHG